MPLSRIFLTPILAVLAISARGAWAQTTVARWTFDSTVADGNAATGTLEPSLGAGTLLLIGGVSGTFVSGAGYHPSSSPNDSALRLGGFPAQGMGSGTAGFQVTLPAPAAPFVGLRWRDAHADVASNYFRIEGSIDGGPWQEWSPWGTTGGASSFGTNDYISRPHLLSGGASVLSLRVVSVFWNASVYLPHYGTFYDPAAPWLIDNLAVVTYPNTPPQITTQGSDFTLAGASLDGPVPCV